MTVLLLVDFGKLANVTRPQVIMAFEEEALSWPRMIDDESYISASNDNNVY